MYQIIISEISGEISCIRRIADNAIIPLDPANTDYQQYIAWLSILGNEPLTSNPETK